MEHYTKASSQAVDSQEKKDVCDIHVKSGSKIRNILAQAFRLLQNKKADKIVLTGSGPTVTKTITCAEIIKRKTKGLHQLNKLFYTKIQDTWEPKEESLDKLQVTRKVPSISITLSKVPLDAGQAGYQAPGKSKSPVQFGEEDWELAWEETQDDSTKATEKTHLEKNAKAKQKSKGTVHKGSAETKTGSLETPSKVASCSQEKHSETGANHGHLKDNINKSQGGHLGSGPLGGEKGQVGPFALESEDRLEGHLEDCVVENEQSHVGNKDGGALENRQSRGWWTSDGGALESIQSHVVHVEGNNQASKQSSEEHLDIAALDIEQIQEGTLGSRVLESEKTGDGCLEHSTLESNQSHGRHPEDGAVQSGLGHSNGSQCTEGAQKRPRSDAGHKSKISPTKKQKAVDS